MTTPANLYEDRILILDFGSQYTQLIARRVRELRVYSEIWNWDVSEEAIRKFNPNGIILSGGPESLTEENSPLAAEAIFYLGVPVLGICYGMQLMARQLGGEVSSSKTSEFGHAKIKRSTQGGLFHYLFDDRTDDGSLTLNVWMSHGDKVSVLPPHFEVIASTDACPIAAMAHKDKPWFGLQFHPEVTHTIQGRRILEQFIVSYCKCQNLWTPANIKEEMISSVREKVGHDKVLLALSGGVDSTVLAAILRESIGEKLICIFVDNGLLRLNEADQVMEMFEQNMKLNVIRVPAQERFLERLSGVSDPEEKRKIIGKTFIEIFDQEAEKILDIKWLAQGTIYPDVIESAGNETGKAHLIKSHHNVGGLPNEMKLSLVEPLRGLFKDEVRQVGLELDLPEKLVYRHPFPGPGLGVRILGEIKENYLDMLRKADSIFIDELREAGWYDKTSQAFVVLLPVKSVGVVGDGRRYEYVVALRAVETSDFMTANWAHLPYDLLGKVSNRIINEISGISRVTYDVSGKPPATIEWE